MRAKFLFLPLLLLLLLLLAACSRSLAAPNGREAVESPEAVAGRFLAACVGGDTAAAVDLLVPEVRAAVLSSGGGPCSSVPVEAEVAHYLMTEVVGQTTTVTHVWSRADGAVVHYHLRLRAAESGWLIFDAHREQIQPTRRPVMPAPTAVLPRASVP
jgi:hypothetical protein